jgi:UDP-2,4-diacetamido-2,4,6-trideoxy-beta-L-altropyranose hydrolase
MLNAALIRTDANFEIGSGHVMRCAALGARLMESGTQVHFVCIDIPAKLATWLRHQGFGLTELSSVNTMDWHTDLAATREVANRMGPFSLLVVDHYRLNKLWESGMRSCASRILVIDDLADRDHDCDLLLDQNLHENAASRYAQRVSSKTVQFLGPRYALLRTEFDMRGLSRTRDGNVHRLLVFFGGGDSENQTNKVVDALRSMGSQAPQCTIVLGFTHPHRDAILSNSIHLPSVRILDSTEKMSILMKEADLAIGTCGIAAWERCALGLPCLVVVTAENQREDAEILHKLGAVKNLGDASKVNAKDWATALHRAMNDAELIRSMSVAAHNVMLGRLAAQAELEAVLNDRH